MIEVTNLTKKYAGKTVVDHISFTIQDRGITGLLGLNGAGKSTTMNMMTGYLAPTEGEIRIGKYNMRENPVEAKRMIGYLPEVPPLYTDMTVWEYLCFIYRLRKVERTQGEYLEQICEKTQVSDIRRRLIGNLSKGYRQRVGIAGILIGDPEILILDEPTVGLDPRQILETLDLMRDLGESQTVIISSHILPEIQELCDNVLVMHHGRLLANNQKGELSEMLRTNHILMVEIDGPKAVVKQTLMHIPGVDRVDIQSKTQDGTNRFLIASDKKTDIRREVFRQVVRMQWSLLEMHSIEPSLEDLFLRMTEKDIVNSEEKPM